MAALTGLTLTKQFPYRGNATEEFSNTYHFKGGVPADDASWFDLANAVWQLERQIFPSWVQWVTAVGHGTDDPKDPAVYSHDFRLTPPLAAGTYVSAGTAELTTAGDQASFAWWKLDYKSTKGKPVFLRKYYHAAFANSAAVDDLGAQYATELLSVADQMMTVHGGLRSSSRDGTVQLAGHGLYITTRTLHKRGKKKKT